MTDAERLELSLRRAAHENTGALAELLRDAADYIERHCTSLESDVRNYISRPVVFRDRKG